MQPLPPAMPDWRFSGLLLASPSCNFLVSRHEYARSRKLRKAFTQYQMILPLSTIRLIQHGAHALVTRKGLRESQTPSPPIPIVTSCHLKTPFKVLNAHLTTCKAAPCSSTALVQKFELDPRLLSEDIVEQMINYKNHTPAGSDLEARSGPIIRYHD